MRKLLSRLALAVVLCHAASAAATSVKPVTFTELLTRADVIFIGEVVDVRPFPLETREGLSVMTRVTFRVSDPLWGTTSAVEVFDFLGGEWNGVGMTVADMPVFAVGDRRVVFARRAHTINPIVGFTQGLLKIERDAAGVERVLTAAGVPLARPEAIGAPARLGAVAGRPMALPEFRDRIRAGLVEARRR